MPTFDFECENGHREEDVLIRSSAAMRTPHFCEVCKLPSKRLMPVFRITGSEAGKSFYEYERDGWALATGRNHKNPLEMERDLNAQGKQIVGKGWKPPKPVMFDEAKCDAALQKIYKDNHTVGEIT